MRWERWPKDLRDGRRRSAKFDGSIEKFDVRMARKRCAKVEVEVGVVVNDGE